VAPSGDVTMTNAGAFTVAKINGVALGTTTSTAGNLLIGSGSQWASVAVTGDVTITSGGVTAIGTNKVTNAQRAQMAANTLKGNNTGATANEADLTAAQVAAMLPAVVGDSGTGGTKGLVPAPASGDAAAGKYLKADGTWATVSAGATPAGTVAGAIQFRGSTAVLAANDTKFIWDNTNFRLGIGTASPAESIDTTGNVRAVVHKVIGQTGLASPGTTAGSSIGTLTANDFCTANAAGTQIVCTTASIGISQINATGTPSATTYLRGDGTWATPSGGGSSSGASGALQFSGGSGTFNADASALFWNNTNKQLGIGTASPNAYLQIYEPAATLTLTSFANLGSTITIGGTGLFTGHNYVLTSTGGGDSIGAGNFAIWDNTAGQYRFSINSSGNVGIGTTNPGTPLDVYGSSATDIFHVRAGTTYFTVGAVDGSYTALNSYQASVGNKALVLQNAGGNVGIGVTNPLAPLQIGSSLSLLGYWPSIGFNAYWNNSASAWQYLRTGEPATIFGADYTNSGLGISVYPSGTANTNVSGGSTPLFLKSNGNVGIGTNNPGYTLDVTSSNPTAAQFTSTAGDPSGVILLTIPNTNSGGHMEWSELIAFNRAGYGLMGSIAPTSEGTAINYNTTSDRRLKENIAPSSSGLDRLMKIEVDDFNFKKDPKKERVQGFIAQDIYKIYPEAVTVGGDDPYKKPWGVDYGRLTPLLVKAIQQLKSQNDDLAAQLKAANQNTRAEIKALKDEIAQLASAAVAGKGVTRP
jgi:hypothetical protein